MNIHEIFKIISDKKIFSNFLYEEFFLSLTIENNFFAENIGKDEIFSQ